jgi:hypothetical protein
VISAEGSYDVNKRPLSYHWALLRGDPNSVQIKPLNENHSRVELSVAFTAGRPIWPGADIESPRVDVGAFVNNGKYFSAPGFVTMYFLPNEARTYDQAGRIVEADYNYGDSTIGYAAGLPRDASYDVADWKPLMDALAPTRDDLPARLLKKHLTANQLAELAVTAREFDAALAGQAGRGDRDATAPGAAVLTKPRPRLGTVSKPNARRLPVAQRTQARTAMDCIEEALNAVKDDPALYVENAARLAELLKSATAADAKAVTDARERLVRGGVLAGDDSAGDDSAGWRLTPLLDGNAPPAARLSTSQRNRLEWFNIELMNRLLYPGALRLKFARDFVPNNLTSPAKIWRDVYHYDSAGKLTGWTRHDGDKAVNFDADGKQAP